MDVSLSSLTVLNTPRLDMSQVRVTVMRSLAVCARRRDKYRVPVRRKRKLAKHIWVSRGRRVSTMKNVSRVKLHRKCGTLRRKEAGSGRQWIEERDRSKRQRDDTGRRRPEGRGCFNVKGERGLGRPTQLWILEES